MGDYAFRNTFKFDEARRTPGVVCTGHYPRQQVCSCGVTFEKRVPNHKCPGCGKGKHALPVNPKA